MEKGLLTAFVALVYSVPASMAQDTVQTEKVSASHHGRSQATKASLIVRGVEWALLVAVVAGFLDTLRFAAFYIPLPFAVNFGEGNILSAALRIARGLTPYPPVGGPPYVVNVYGPVIYYLLAPLVKWFGLSFTAPRLLVLASGLAVALLLVLLLRHWTESWVIALGFGVSFLAVSMVRDWVYVLRVEMFATALSLAGLYIFAVRKSLLWPALLFLAALFTKVTFLAAPIACFLYMILSGDRRRAWQFTGWMLLFGTAGLLALGLGTNGWGLFHMFMTHPDPYRLEWFFDRWIPFARLDFGLGAGAVTLGVLDIRRRNFSLPFIYCALASVMTLTVGKAGGDVNELLEWQAAMCLAAGCGYAALRNYYKSEAAIVLIPIGVLVLVLLGLPQSLRLNPGLDGCPAAYRFAAQEPGQLLTENPGIATLSGKKIWLSEPFEFVFLGRAGRLDQEPLARMIGQRFFGLILIRKGPRALEQGLKNPGPLSLFWPPQFAKAVLQNYHPVARFACAYANVAYEPDRKRGTYAGADAR